MDPPSPIAPGQRSAGIARTIGRNLGWMLASRGVLAILSLFYLGIVARSLGVVGFGRFSLIWGAAQTLATLVAFQTWQIIVTYGVEALRAGDENRLARLFRASALLDLGSALVGALLAALTLQLFSEQLGIGPTLKRAALILAVVNVVTFRSTPLGILRLEDRFSWAAMADSVTPVTRFLGSIAVLLVHPTVQGFMVAWGAAEVLTALTYWIMAARLDGMRLIRRGQGMATMLRENPGIVRFALSTNASSTLALSSKQLPLLIVGGALGPAAAGSFRLAAQVAQALAKLSQLLSRAAFPEVVRAVHGAPAAALRALLARMIAVSLLTGGVILALVALLGLPTLDLIGGRHFAHSYGVLMWMAAAGCIDLATVAIETVMTARGRAVTVLGVRIVAALLILLAAWPLLTLFGTTGMATAVCAGSLAGMVLMTAMAWFGLASPRSDS